MMINTAVSLDAALNNNNGMLESINDANAFNNKETDNSVRDKLIKENIDYAKSVAWKFRPYADVPVEDLISAGMLGLLKGVETYDSSKGKFSTYIYFWIKKEIITAILETKTILIPDKIDRLLRKNKLPKELKYLYSMKVVSANEKISDEEDEFIDFFVGDNIWTPEEEYRQGEIRELLG